jgi:hypothetical protein
MMHNVSEQQFCSLATFVAKWHKYLFIKLSVSVVVNRVFPSYIIDILCCI